MHKSSEEYLIKLKKEIGLARMEAFRKRIEEPLNDEGRTEIIILKYKNPNIEVECLDKIVSHTHSPYKLTFYDNRNNSPNMSKIWNKLIKEATCENIVVMDTDAFVADGWLEPLLEALKIPDCGMVGPVNGQLIGINPQNKASRDADAYESKEHISGYCFAMRKNVWKELGGFDEDFLIFGQDADMCERILASDYKLYIAPRSLVYHGHKEINGEYYHASVSTKQAEKDGEYDIDAERFYPPNLIEYRKQTGFYESLYSGK